MKPYLIVGDAAVGSAGAATVTTTSKGVISGRVAAVGVVYRGSAPSTTDVTIRTANKNGSLPDVTILTLTSANTSVWVHPFVLADDAAGADITGVYTAVVIHDQVEVVVAEADSGSSVDVTLLME